MCIFFLFFLFLLFGGVGVISFVRDERERKIWVLIGVMKGLDGM